jgi:two-component system, chemotaxis family, chemotaxis protein CheY
MLSCISDPTVREMAEQAGKRLLIVDDAALVRRFYREALEQAGFVVEEAFNGVEALEKVDDCDLVIVDVNMPKMDGLTFIRALRRRSPPVASIPALVISTEAASQDFRAACDAGANFYLIKPISQPLLVEYVAMMCGVPR